MTSAELTSALRASVSEEGWDWLQEAIAAVGVEPAAIRARFPAVGRKVGRGPLDPAADPLDVHAWTVDDAARALLLVALAALAGPEGSGEPQGNAAVLQELEGLYRHGDAAERRAVLRALPLLPIGDEAVGLVLDAVRTNDTRLIAAALGPYAASHLDDHDYHQAVLKCVFVGVPLAGIAGLPERCTPALARMLARYAHERIAAGRDVPAETWPLIERYPPTEELAAIHAELEHPVAERRAAARRALAARRAREEVS